MGEDESDPAHALAAETLNLDCTLSDLVNQAYGLAPAEIALMWQTAPPRDAHPAALRFMKKILLMSYASIVALSVLLVAGCRPGDSAYTAFAISTVTSGQGSNACYAALIQMVGQGCTIWSDAGPWQSGELRPHTASASCLLPDGRQLGWKCQTPDGKTFTHLEICGRDYLLANGGLFLISTRAGRTQVVQIKPPEYKFASLDDLAPLSDQFPEVAQFLAGKPIVLNAPIGERPRSATPP